MDSISASTSAIRSTAGDIISKAKNYKAAFDAMYDQIRALGATWTSEDGNAYIAKIEGFHREFEDMYRSLINTANSLDTDAANYEHTVKTNTVV